MIEAAADDGDVGQEKVSEIMWKFGKVAWGW